MNPENQTSNSRPPEHGDPNEAWADYYGPHALQPIALSNSFATARSMAWTTSKTNWAHVIRRAERPDIRVQKDGISFCFVDLNGPETEIITVEQRSWKPGGRRRILENVVNVWCVGFDYDTGEIGVEDMIARLTDLRIESVVYTSHSHLKTISLPSDADVQSAKKVGQGIIEYMCEHDKLPRITEPQPELLPDGRIKHAPWPKFRVVVLLKEPFAINGKRENAARFKRGYHELAAKIGASTIDPSCSDPARIFYSPVKRNPTAPYTWRHVRGTPVDFDDLVLNAPPSLPRARVKAARLQKNQGTARSKRKPAVSKVNNSAAPIEFDTRLLQNCELVSVIASSTYVEIRGGDVGSGKVDIECPFDADHSNAGDPNDRACFVTNASLQEPDSKGNRWPVVRCMHAHCAHRLTEDFVAKLVADGALPMAALDHRFPVSQRQSMAQIIADMKAAKEGTK